MKSGFVAVVGRPNVGKSTLVNALVGSKVAITSSRPQTTRNTIRGVVTGPPGPEPEYQIVLVDTPGLHKPKTQLGSRLNSMVYGTLTEADVVVFMIDATAAVGPGDRLIATRLGDARSKVVLVVNKTDKGSRAEVVEQLARAADWDFAAYVPISARDGTGLEDLIGEIVPRLPEGPRYYPEGVTTDQPESLVISEIIREKFLDRLEDEVPHSLVVRVENVEQRDDGILDVEADLVVERSSQRGIVIGKGASLLKAGGSEARRELEALFGTKVHLALHVVVEKDWQGRPQILDRFGFES